MTLGVTVEQIAPNYVVPVVVAEEVAAAQPLAQALSDGGIRCAEITMRTPTAVEIIAAMAELDDFVVGAGTVCTADHVDLVADAGAQFVVSPGLSEAVINRCRDRNLLSLPGVATASEIMAARDLGLNALKFFPASVIGGPGAIKALGGPFRDVTFIPTGGVSSANMSEYLALGNVAAVGGSWLTPTALQEQQDWSAITALASEACRISGQVRPPTPDNTTATQKGNL